MAEVTFDEIGAAVVARIKDQVTELHDNVIYPWPEKPPAALSAWVDVGPTDYELGGLEIATHTITVTVVVPFGVGGQAGQIKTIHATAFNCLKAFRGDAQVADEAILSTVGATISKPSTFTLGEGGSAVTACTLTFYLQTLDGVETQIAP